MFFTRKRNTENKEWNSNFIKGLDIKKTFGIVELLKMVFLFRWSNNVCVIGSRHYVEDKTTYDRGELSKFYVCITPLITLLLGRP